MSTIILTPGVLPPACYETEQQRFTAYVEAIVAALEGGLQWDTGSSTPEDEESYWLRTTAEGLPVEARKWDVANGVWTPLLSSITLPTAAGGTAGAWTLTNSPPIAELPTAYATRRTYAFIAPFTTTGALTVAVDGLAAKTVVKGLATPIAAGDITAGQMVVLIYDGTNFQLVSPVPAPAAVSLPRFETTAEFTIPAASNKTTASHTLGVIPHSVRVVAVCKEAVDDYSVGDEISAETITAMIFGTRQETSAYSISASADTITVSSSRADSGVRYIKKNGGYAEFDEAVNEGKWAFKAYLIATPAA